MMRRWVLAALSLASASASDASVDRQKFCFDACRYSFKAVRFSNPDNITDFFMNECSNILRLESLYLCADTRCSATSRDEGLRGMNETCRDLGVSLPGLDIIQKYSDEDISQLARFEKTRPGLEHALGSPALPTEEFLDVWIATLVRLRLLQALEYSNIFLGCLRVCSLLSHDLRLGDGLLLGRCCGYWDGHSLHGLYGDAKNASFLQGVTYMDLDQDKCQDTGHHRPPMCSRLWRLGNGAAPTSVHHDRNLYCPERLLHLSWVPNVPRKHLVSVLQRGEYVGLTISLVTPKSQNKCYATFPTGRASSRLPTFLSFGCLA